MSEREPEQINIDEELRRYARANPFFPFDIVMTSGDRYTVNSDLSIAVGNTAIVLILPKTGTQILRKNQIVAIHVHEPAS